MDEQQVAAPDRLARGAHRFRAAAAPVLPLLGVLIGWTEPPAGLLAATLVGIGGMVALLATNSWAVKGRSARAEVAVDTAVAVLVGALLVGDAPAAAWLVVVLPLIEAAVRLGRRAVELAALAAGTSLVTIELFVVDPARSASAGTRALITVVVLAVVTRAALAVGDEMRLGRSVRRTLRREGRRRGRLLDSVAEACQSIDAGDPLEALGELALDLGAHRAQLVLGPAEDPVVVEVDGGRGEMVPIEETLATSTVCRGAQRVRLVTLDGVVHVGIPVDDRAVVVAVASSAPGPLVQRSLEIAARHAAARRREPVV